VHSFVLQDWNVAAGPGGASTFTQDEGGWLDLAPFQDAVIYVDCRETSGPPTIVFETSPCREDALFQPLASMTMTSAAPQPNILRAIMLGTTVPLARYLRWKITGPAGAWDATFRAIVVANSPGM
jgi:hypothetical protein